MVSKYFKGVLSLMFYKEAIEIWWLSVCDCVLVKNSSTAYWVSILKKNTWVY